MKIDTSRLQEYSFEDYKVITNFKTFEEAQAYASESNGELVEVGFTDQADNPLRDNSEHLIEKKIPFLVELPPEYTVIYSSNEAFQEWAAKVLEALKEKENDIAPEDWLSDQNIAPSDRIIILKNGELNTVTTRERIKYLMRGKVYEIAVKIVTNTD
ncbi:hypothetical protein D1631_18565 [Chryseobacterium nematophagum]|uniref:Uncharacterized protein n=1 Tax=Chryseobacterium nematophagum TaxID=2305228 RepID=A0A3M7TC20_9FLAO|nr:hypothetical protein [Chryseobacterium nematophagum]RNA60494.1 hypothetical protein D1631_18565 [Chryseobacterium nematophagum]